MTIVLTIPEFLSAAAAANNSTPPTVVPQQGQTVPLSTTPTGKVISGSPAGGTGSGSSNSTIINLLNSAPAAMTNKLGTSGTGGHSTPGPPTLVNAFSGLVSPPPSSVASSSSQYGNSPATPITGTANAVGPSLVSHEEPQQSILIQQQQLTKPLTKQQMTRLLNGGTESPGLSSPSPSEGSGTEQQQQQQQQSSRVTMSALASQLASPPAIMTNSIIQANKHLVAAQQQQAAAAVKVNLTGQGNTVYGLNGLHQGATIVHQGTTSRVNSSSTPTPPPPIGGGGGVSSSSSRRDILANIMSPGSDSNHSTASSFSLSMPTLNNLLASGPTSVGGMSREIIGGPSSVGGTSSNGGNSMPPSPSHGTQMVVSAGVGVLTNKVTTSGGNILTIHASPGPGSSGGLISNNMTQSNQVTASGSAAMNNSMLIDRLTAMANSGTSGGAAGGGVVTGTVTNNVAVPTSILQLQSQSPFLANVMSATGGGGSKMVVTNSSNLSQQQQPQQQHQTQQFTIPVASPKGGTVTQQTVLQNIQLQAASTGSPVVSGNVSPQTGTGGGGQQTTTLNLQGLNLASLQGAMATIPGLQNVQVRAFPSWNNRAYLSIRMKITTKM